MLLALVACGGSMGRDDASPTVQPAHLVVVLASDLRVDLDHPFASELSTAYAPSSLDVQSAAAVFTGRLPTRAGAVGVDEAQPPPEAPTLPAWLRAAGYSTAWFSQASWGARDGFTRGVDWVETAPASGWSEEDVIRRFERALTELLPEGAPPAFIAAHLDTPLALTPDDLESGRTAEAWRADYVDRASRVLDVVQRMADRVRESAVSTDRTVVFVFAGLSGFELGEHEGLGSGWTLSEASIRVPLLAERFQGESTETLFADTEQALPPSLVDLTPTLLDFAGVSQVAQDPDLLDGSSWAVINAGRTSWAPEPPDRPRIAELVVRERRIVRAVIDATPDGPLKYVRASRTVPIADRPALLRGYEEIQAAMLSGATPTPELFGPAAEESLYRLQHAGDRIPSEVLHSTADGEGRRLISALRRYAELTNRTGYPPLALTRRLDIDPNEMRELESLGYL